MMVPFTMLRVPRSSSMFPTPRLIPPTNSSPKSMSSSESMRLTRMPATMNAAPPTTASKPPRMHSSRLMGKKEHDRAGNDRDGALGRYNAACAIGESTTTAYCATALSWACAWLCFSDRHINITRHGLPPEARQGNPASYLSPVAVGEKYMVVIGSKKVYCLTRP